MTLGHLLGAALRERASPEDRLVFAVSDLVATHYGLHPDEVAGVLWEIAVDLLERGGSLSETAKDPHGLSVVALMAAHRLLGSDEVERIPLLAPSVH